MHSTSHISFHFNNLNEKQKNIFLGLKGYTELI